MRRPPIKNQEHSENHIHNRKRSAAQIQDFIKTKESLKEVTESNHLAIGNLLNGLAKQHCKEPLCILHRIIPKIKMDASLKHDPYFLLLKYLLRKPTRQFKAELCAKSTLSRQNNQTPLELAKEQGIPAVIDLLSEYSESLTPRESVDKNQDRFAERDQVEIQLAKDFNQMKAELADLKNQLKEADVKIAELLELKEAQLKATEKELEATEKQLRETKVMLSKTAEQLCNTEATLTEQRRVKKDPPPSYADSTLQIQVANLQIEREMRIQQHEMDTRKLAAQETTIRTMREQIQALTAQLSQQNLLEQGSRHASKFFGRVATTDQATQTTAPATYAQAAVKRTY